MPGVLVAGAPDDDDDDDADGVLVLLFVPFLILNDATVRGG